MDGFMKLFLSKLAWIAICRGSFDVFRDKRKKKRKIRRKNKRNRWRIIRCMNPKRIKMEILFRFKGRRLRRIVFLNGFNRGEIETIFFFPAPFAQRICTTRAVSHDRTRSWLPVDIHSGKLVARGCEPWWRIASSLSGARRYALLSLSLFLSPCVSPLSLLPLAPVNWCVGTGWTQITREEFRLSNPRWSCAPLSPLPRSLLLSFALFPVSSLIFLSSFLLASSLLSRPLLLPLFVSHFFSPLANNNIFPTNIYILEINFFPFFFFSYKNSNSWNRFLIFPFLPFFFSSSSFSFSLRSGMIVFSREREKEIVTSHVFLQSIDSWYRDSEQSIGDVRSPIRLDLYRPLGHVTSHCRVVYRGFVAESAGCMGPLLEIIARKIAPVADVNGAIRKRGRLPLPLKIRIKRKSLRKSFGRNFNGKDIRENRNATRGL